MNLYIKWGFMAAYFTQYNVCKSYLCCGLYGYFVYSYHQIIFNYILFPSVLAGSVYNTALKMLLEGFTKPINYSIFIHKTQDFMLYIVIFDDSYYLYFLFIYDIGVITYISFPSDILIRQLAKVCFSSGFQFQFQ